MKMLQAQLHQHNGWNSSFDNMTLNIQNHSGRTKDANHISLVSVFAIGVRMALVSCSAADFPICAMADVSRQTVTRCEIAAAAALRARYLVHNCVFVIFGLLR